jgi:hypothetical protein
MYCVLQQQSMYEVIPAFVQDAIEKAPERGSHQGRITCTIFVQQIVQSKRTSSQGVVKDEPSS